MKQKVPYSVSIYNNLQQYQYQNILSKFFSNDTKPLVPYLVIRLSYTYIDRARLKTPIKHLK